MALKIIKAIKAQQQRSIKHMIHETLAGWEPARPHGLIHASDLMKDKEFCPREWAFLDMGLAKKGSDYIGTALRITFDHGRDMEWRLRNEWLRHAMIGFWECGVCGHVHEVFGKAPKIKCPSCGWGHQWEYHEVRLVDAKSGISGGVDGFVDIGNTKARLLEIKSMDKDEHKGLLAPKAEHKFRTALYLKLAEHSNLPQTDRIDQTEATVLYVSKSFGFKDTSLKEAGIKDSPFSPFKEFAIKRDDTLVATPVAKATALTLWRTMKASGGSTGLPCGVCSSGLVKRAQQCSSVSPCWSGNFPATITWKENGMVRHPGKPIVSE